MLHRITALDTETGQRELCFTWRGDPKTGLVIARRDAVEWGRAFVEFQEEPVGESA